MKKEKEKIKKPWYKRKLIWAIIIIVFIMAIGSNGESTSAENTKKNTAAADTQQQPNTESADTTRMRIQHKLLYRKILRNRKKMPLQMQKTTRARLMALNLRYRMCEMIKQGIGVFRLLQKILKCRTVHWITISIISRMTRKFTLL